MIPAVAQLRGRRSTSGERALTLVEAVLAVAIVAILVVSALRATGSVARTQLIQKDRSAAMALARHLFSEIMSSAYTDGDDPTHFGAEHGEARSGYDDVDDYDGLSESPPCDSTGSALSGYTGWTRTAEVRALDQSLLGSLLGTDTGLKRIVVRVTSPSGQTVTLTGLRSSASAYDKNVSSQSTYVSKCILVLKVGKDARGQVVSAVNPLNQIP